MTPSHETSTYALATSTRSVREARPIAVSGELGWNALSGGLGVLVSWSPAAHLALDGGLGVGLAGPQVGLQGRYNLKTTALTPYLALGVAQSFGSLGTATMDDIRFDVPAQRSAQASVGLSYVNRRGFSMLVGLGYAMAFGDDRVRVVGGSPTPSQRDTLDSLLGSGVMASVALGYSFKG